MARVFAGIAVVATPFRIWMGDGPHATTPDGYLDAVKVTVPVGAGRPL
jgi:hypothetical protein